MCLGGGGGGGALGTFEKKWRAKKHHTGVIDLETIGTQHMSEFEEVLHT